MMALESDRLSASRLASLCVPEIFAAFEEHQAAFAEITRRAAGRFQRRDWSGAVADAVERLDLYGVSIDRIEETIRKLLGRRVADPMLWTAMKAVYSSQIGGRDDYELAETYFNSVTRRIFATVGVDPNIEFVASDFEAPPPEPREAVWQTFEGPLDPEGLLATIVPGGRFGDRWRDAGGDALAAGLRLRERLRELGLPEIVDRAEMVRSTFFRRKGAYLLGRVFSAGTAVPLALVLLNTEAGVTVDAVLTDEDDVSILFSFTRSHFHVESAAPGPLLRYLKLLMPKKPVAELYIALGHHKHGKTELYRDLLRHLGDSEHSFDLAPGTPGMVMIVFAMPGYDVVLKVIRDHFPAIKPITPAAVRQNYHLVFRHDRAGRLVEAQEFEHLEFERSRFTPRLLEEFARDADRSVAVEPGKVVVHHAYLERRVNPLDVHLREADAEAARAAVVDFGQAVKDLAANNVFPGELLPKNFGLTRHSRVVCYDYDELGFLTDFTFRELPEARCADDDLSEEAWFGVGPKDVFPAELARFLGLPADLATLLKEAHPELYRVDFWTRMQERVRRGEIIDIYPYPHSRRLRAEAV